MKNKKVLITGVSKGIGKATALALLEKGAKVEGWSRSTVDINHENFTHQSVDVTDASAVEEAFNSLQNKWNGIDGLINNAGLGYFKKMEYLSMEEWHKMFDVNVHGIFNITRLAVPVMKKQESGHIINISSIAGLQGISEATAYCGTKYAVKGISEALYGEVKKRNIKVTCIYPGSINTDFFVNYDRVNANDSMMHPNDIANTIIYALESAPNVCPQNIEIRPLNPSYD